MSVETVLDMPVIRLSKMFLDNIIRSPSKSFAVTLGDEVYSFKVSKKLGE